MARDVRLVLYASSMRSSGPIAAVLGATVLALVACGGGGGGGGGDDVPPNDGKLPDSSHDGTELAGDFSCAGTAWPTTAPDPLSFTGRVTDPVTTNPAGPAAVELRRVADDGVLAMGTSTASGIFAFNVVTAGAAPKLYRKATLAGHVDGYTYDPFAVFDGNQSGRGIYAPVPASRDAYYQAAGLVADAAKGTVLVEILDCAGLAVAGATVDTGAAAGRVYLDDGGAPAAALAATSSVGTVVLLGVPAGALDVAVHAGSRTYRAWPISSRAGAFVYSPRLP